MENIINEEQLEKMRRKAKKLEKIVTIVSTILFPIYICLFYVVMVQKEGISVIFIVKLIIAAAILSIVTFMILWLIIVKHVYDKFNETFKSKYVLQTIHKINGFDDLRYYQKNGFSWDDIRNMAVVACGDKRYFENEDLLFGIYENVRFKISDVTTKKMVRGNKKIELKKYSADRFYVFSILIILKLVKDIYRFLKKNFYLI